MKQNHIFFFGGLLILILSIFFKSYLILSKKFQLSIVINAIKNLEENYDDNFNNDFRRPRIVIGFGGCTDYFSRAIDCFDRLNVSHTEYCHDDVAPGESRDIYTLEDLAREFSIFFGQGAAAERYIHDSKTFEIIHNATISSKGFSTYLGGNAPVMANRLAQDGANVLLGAKLSRHQIKFLHENVSVVVIADDDESEDRHLIFEYDVGDKWGPVVTPRANRFIVHRDQHTPYLTGLDELKLEMNKFKPDLFILGGLQMMDGFPYPMDDKKIQIDKLEIFLDNIDKKIPIHFEMASFVERDLLLMLKKQVIPYADSLGFNEQELPNLLSILEHDSITTVSSAYPRTSQMLDHMRRVWEILIDEGDTKRNKLSRLHLHTLGYQIIMINKHSTFWRSSRFPVVKASLVAHRHTCGMDNIDVERSKLLTDDSFSISGIPNSPRVHFNISDPVSCWEEREVEVCVAPVLVCTKVIKTVGGGDNISSATLLNQLKISV